MKINDVSYSKAAGSLRKRRDVEGGGQFEAFLEETSTAGSAVQQPSSVGGVDALLSVQEVGDALSAPHKEAIQGGLDMLDSLEQLRLALLQGALPEHQLVNIRNRVEKQKANVSDPKLSAILQDIELRAAVELAKLEMAALKIA